MPWPPDRGAAAWSRAGSPSPSLEAYLLALLLSAFLNRALATSWITETCVQLWPNTLARDTSSSASSVPGEWFPAFSPDGHWVSFVARLPSGRDHLIVRSFPEPTSSLQISPDTLLAGRPFWSADGQSVGYQTQIGSGVFETRLKLAGGLAVLSRTPIQISMPAAILGASQPAFATTAFAPNGGLLGIKLEALTGGDVVVPNWITELRERIAATAAR